MMATPAAGVGNLSHKLSSSGNNIVQLPTAARRRSASFNQNGSERRGSTMIRSASTVSGSDAPAGAALSNEDLPLKEIPGGYGLPFFGAIKDRLDFHWFQGMPKFYTDRRDKYQSTVYRTNVPPGPPFYPDPRVIVLIDEKTYPVLFDTSKVWKKDVFTGTYMPSVKMTGGYRVLPYLDPSEPKHEKLKNFAFEILKSSGSRMLPNLNASMTSVFANWEAALKKDGKASFANDLALGCFTFMMKAFIKRDPTESGDASLGTTGPSVTQFWVIGQIGPIAAIPNPQWYVLLLAPLIELFLHTLPIPNFLVARFYKKLVEFFRVYGTELVDFAEKQLGLDREEALHNLVFICVFNAYGGVNILFPNIVKRLGSTSAEYQKELSAEVAKALKENGGELSPKALAAMPLVQSVVYEVLRIDPPVPYQYAKAKEDMIIKSYDASFKVKKGETLAGYMPTATADPKVFDDPLSFLPKRFVGEEGQALLKYVLWSNGQETSEPTVSNKQCPGKDLIPFLAQAFVASVYSKYETMQVDPSNPANLTTLKAVST